jgi:anthranilate/para-aminobenzoate synthase component I
VKLSDIAARPSFALLGPGYAGDGFVLVAPLAAAPADARVIYVPYETSGDAAHCFTGEVTRVATLELDVAPVRAEPCLDADGHAAAVDTIRAAIAAGDVYQVNLTLRARLQVDPDAGAALFAALLRRGVPRFAAWVRLPTGEEFASASPELLFAMRGGLVRCEPMKGTARPEQARELAASDKDRAELAMITDLVRNDLTPVCEPRSVRVVCERRSIPLPYALQTVSEIEGRLLPGRGPIDVLAALHPGGSVTGAPKHAAMSFIRALETSPRGPYCGALGFVDRDAAIFGLNIRTAWRRSEDWIYGVGGGIVWDSDPARELEEARLKLGALS